MFSKQIRFIMKGQLIVIMAWAHLDIFRIILQICSCLLSYCNYIGWKLYCLNGHRCIWSIHTMMLILNWCLSLFVLLNWFKMPHNGPQRYLCSVPQPLLLAFLIVVYDWNSRFLSSHVITNSFGKKPVINSHSGTLEFIRDWNSW